MISTARRITEMGIRIRGELIITTTGVIMGITMGTQWKGTRTKMTSSKRVKQKSTCLELASPVHLCHVMFDQLFYSSISYILWLIFMDWVVFSWSFINYVLERRSVRG